MHKTTHDIRRDQTEQPEYEKDYGNGIKHLRLHEDCKKKDKKQSFCMKYDRIGRKRFRYENSKRKMKENCQYW